MKQSIKAQFKTFFNCYLAEYYYCRKEAIAGNKPRIFAIEITNYCNLNCLMCPRKFMKREIGFMDFNLFKKIIGQIKTYTTSVWLHNFGEPLFHPDLERFINYCAENNIRPAISTNATILNEKKTHMLLNSELDHIILAVDGANKQTYQQIRQGADFDKVCSNVTNFLKIKKSLKKNKPFSEVQILRMDKTTYELDMFKRQWSNLADSVFIKDFCVWADQAEPIKNLQKEKRIYHRRGVDRQRCMAFWRDGVVLWNGDFVPCCMDFDGKMVLGNLGTETLADIWNSYKIRKVREEQVKNNFNNPLCINCNEWFGRQSNIFFLRQKILPYFIRYFKKTTYTKL